MGERAWQDAVDERLDAEAAVRKFAGVFDGFEMLLSFYLATHGEAGLEAHLSEVFTAECAAGLVRDLVDKARRVANSRPAARRNNGR